MINIISTTTLLFSFFNFLGVLTLIFYGIKKYNVFFQGFVFIKNIATTIDLLSLIIGATHISLILNLIPTHGYIFVLFFCFFSFLFLIPKLLEVFINFHFFKNNQNSSLYFFTFSFFNKTFIKIAYFTFLGMTLDFYVISDIIDPFLKLNTLSCLLCLSFIIYIHLSFSKTHNKILTSIINVSIISMLIFTVVKKRNNFISGFESNIFIQNKSLIGFVYTIIASFSTALYSNDICSGFISLYLKKNLSKEDIKDEKSFLVKKNEMFSGVIATTVFNCLIVILLSSAKFLTQDVICNLYDLIIPKIIFNQDNFQFVFKVILNSMILLPCLISFKELSLFLISKEIETNEKTTVIKKIYLSLLFLTYLLIFLTFKKIQFWLSIGDLQNLFMIFFTINSNIQLFSLIFSIHKFLNKQKV